MEFGVGSIVDGKVSGITKFGAFVALPEGKSGLVHISEIAHTYVSEVSEHLSEGQEVKVKVIGIDESNRINLSIKKATDPPPRQMGGNDRPPRQFQGGARNSGGDRNFNGGDRNHNGGDRNHGGGDRNHGGGDRNYGGGDRNHNGGDRNHGGGDRNYGGGDRNHGGGDRNHGGGYQNRPPVYTPRQAPKEPTDFEDKLKCFMQSSDSKLAEMRHVEKKGTRRGRK